MKRMLVNQRANKMMKLLCLERGIEWCEIRLSGCWYSGNNFAHRHKGRWYYDKPISALWDLNQWVLSCPNCHEKIEYDSNLTKNIFLKLRGKDKYE